MDIYHIFADLKPDVSDVAFADHLKTFMDKLQSEGKITSWRLMRRKLGLGPKEMGEFHIMVETEDLAQLDRAFNATASRTGHTETNHFAVNTMVRQVSFALYRDFPDPIRQHGEEKF